MTPEHLAKIEARAALGTPLAAEMARQDIPALCAALREAWREREAAREVLAFIEARAAATVGSRGGPCLCFRVTRDTSVSASQHADQALETIAAMARQAWEDMDNGRD